MYIIMRQQASWWLLSIVVLRHEVDVGVGTGRSRQASPICGVHEIKFYIPLCVCIYMYRSIYICVCTIELSPIKLHYPSHLFILFDSQLAVIYVIRVIYSMTNYRVCYV